MCTHCSIPTQNTEAFSDQLLQMLNHGALSLMVSIGHRTGLFDYLAGRDPESSTQVAEGTGLHERYVREWLYAMTVAGILASDPEGRVFHLPDAHATVLTRANPSSNMAVFMQYISVLGSVESDVVECFRKGGGVPYSRYREFHRVMAEDSNQTIVSSLLDTLLPAVPGLVERLEAGIDVLDVGCGSGRALNLLARTFPRSRFSGLDLSDEAIDIARAEAAANEVENAAFFTRDLTTFDTDAPENAYDVIFAFDAIHDQARPDRVLRGIARALRPDGLFFMQDIAGSSNPANNMDHPLGGLLYSISCLHCMTVSLAQGGLGYGAMWGREKALEELEKAGFASVDVRDFEHDVQNHYYLARLS